jgi:hypothetical protein
MRYDLLLCPYCLRLVRVTHCLFDFYGDICNYCNVAYIRRF